VEEEHEELQRMMDGMKEAIKDAYTLKQKYYITTSGENYACSINPHDGDAGGSGAVIICSKTNRILSTASKELTEQLQLLRQEVNGWITWKNPLITSVILAIQGISRMERQTAYNEGSLTSETFRNGQYLCTGLTMFLTREPNTYEAMALVHSRISRVIYGVPRINGGGFGGGILHGITSNSNDGNIGEPPVYIHHHYRVFCCNPNSDLYKECRKLHPF
jgi:tRNA(Arg) A34 adenosine deaminase TadA